MRLEHETASRDWCVIGPDGASDPDIGEAAEVRTELQNPQHARHSRQAPEGSLPPAAESRAFDQWVRPALARCLLASVPGGALALPWEQVLEELGLPVGNAA